MTGEPIVIVVQETFFGSFRKFLMETNAVALAIAVILGAAAGKLVSAITDGLFMPLIGMLLPDGDWRSLRIVLKEGTRAADCPGNLPMDARCRIGEAAIMVGQIIGATLDFLVVALVVFLIGRHLLKLEIKR